MAKAPRGVVQERSLEASAGSVRILAVADSRGRDRSADLCVDPFPERIAPCIPTLTPAAPAGNRWWHEIKWDGYRLIGFVRDGKVCLRTRRGHDWTDRFPVIAAALCGLPVRRAILDGEAVVLD